MSIVPKEHYRSTRADSTSQWPQSGIHPVTAKKPVVSASSSFLDVQGQAPPLPAESQAETLSIWPLVLRAGNSLRAASRWWLRTDFRTVQVPILVLALGIWGVSARWAWNSQESATPLLRESIAKIRQEKIQAAMGSVTVAPISRVRVIPPGAAPAIATKPVATVPNRQQRQNAGFVHALGALRAWLLPQRAAAERVEGNPRRRVWVDMKTGLYYCPGADYYGYGGEDRGKVMSQKEAEYDYFQPATGAPCE